jgi:quercetin dioxygenase-like cupin family protein
MNAIRWIWAGPIAFIIHDAEEVATAERWLLAHREQLPRVLQPLATITTIEIAMAVLVLVVGFVLAAAHGAARARQQRMSIPFLLIAGAFIANAFTHVAQALEFRGYTPGVVTAVLVVLPYGAGLARSLVAGRLATWRTCLLAVAVGVVLQIPLALLAMAVVRRQPPSQPGIPASAATAGPRATVIAAGEGERRFLRGGAAPLLIKIDPVTTGSQRMVLGSSDLPPGDSIGVHRHLREDEIMIITRGTARVQLGAQRYSAGPGAIVFIPQGTCIAIANTGSDTLSNTFVFSAPGFEQVLRAVSSPAGAPPKAVSPAERAAAFHHGNAQAWPTDC